MLEHGSLTSSDAAHDSRRQLKMECHRLTRHQMDYICATNWNKRSSVSY
eukprot:COSAG06_NODE_47990_length_335_cov_0.881356_1_plen_48_part_10